MNSDMENQLETEDRLEDDVKHVEEIVQLESQIQSTSLPSMSPSSPTTPQPLPSSQLHQSSFIKILLHETDDIVLYEQKNLTISKDNEEEYNLIEADNKLYDSLTIGKSRNRRTSNAETQTIDILFKSRAVNTIKLQSKSIETFVSNYDMYDTYQDLETYTESIDTPDRTRQIRITTYKNRNDVSGADDESVEMKLGNNDQFKLSSMVLQRLLAGNIYRERQRRFRNMIAVDPLDKSLEYLYRLDTLWKYKIFDTIDKPISCISFCPVQQDLLAIGYGIYHFKSSITRPNGYVCVWNCKNPINPERRYRYEVPVTCVSFSNRTPQLLAIGLYNGQVEVHDITHSDGPPIARTERINYDPIWNIEWIRIGKLKTAFTDNYPDEHLLIVSQSGLIIKSKIINGPFLLSYRQMNLVHVIGYVQGLSKIIENKIFNKKIFLDASPHPQALTLQIHPLKSDIYFIGTDEGCLHKCSIFYPNQHINVFRVHNGYVNCMEFSPFSSKIFLTCGSDFYIRIWIEGITEPVVELKNTFEPIHCAYWNPKNSTIIVGVTKTKLELWDIRRNTLKPCSITEFDNQQYPLTICKFTECGKSIIVGDSNGTAYVCALEDMPIPAHFQYDELLSAIYRNLIAKADLQQQIRNLGYLGY